MSSDIEALADSTIEARPEPLQARRLRILFLHDQIQMAEQKLKLLADMGFTHTEGYAQAYAQNELNKAEFERLMASLPK